MAIVESELRWPRLGAFRAWRRDPEAVKVQPAIAFEQERVCRMELLIPEYDILVDYAFGLGVETEYAVNFLLNEERAHYEKLSADREDVETRAQVINRLLSAINRHFKMMGRIESADRPERFYKRFNTFLLPENKDFLNSLAEEFDWSKVQVGNNTSAEGIVLTGFLPQAKDENMPPLYLAGSPVSEEFAVRVEPTRPTKNQLQLKAA